MTPEVLVLAERLRVEERLVLSAIADLGLRAELVNIPEYLRLVQNQRGTECGSLTVSMLTATRESAALSRVGEQAGYRVHNQSQLADCLADRLRLRRSLLAGGIPVTQSKITYGSAMAIDALDEIGYPARVAILQSEVEPIPIMDRDAAEAIIEHRTVLGGDRLFLASPYEVGPTRRLYVVGLVQVATQSAEGDGWELAPGTESDLEIASAMRDVLGSGMYRVDIVGDNEPRVDEVTTVGRFRSDDGSDQAIAEAIAGMAAMSVGIAAQ